MTHAAKNATYYLMMRRELPKCLLYVLAETMYVSELNVLVSMVLTGVFATISITAEPFMLKSSHLIKVLGFFVFRHE